MNITSYKNTLKEIEGQYSDDAVCAVENILESLKYDDRDIEEISWEEAVSYFNYDSDAYNYLMDQVGGDLSEAIENGMSTIIEIAYYYLHEEINQIIEKLKDNEN